MAVLTCDGGAVRRYGGTAVGLLVSIIVQMTGPCQLEGQTLGAPVSPGGPQHPAWLTEWSPLRCIADLPRELPGGVASFPALLTLPAPRVGLFWTAGNPGALPLEAGDAYAQIRTGYNRHSGEYRRPLDAGTDSRAGGSAFGWKSLAANGAAIGRVVAERVSYGDGAHGDVTLPHSSNPFVVMDTLGDALAGTTIRLEGAGGWQIGGLGIGLGLGYDGREIRTVESPVPRQYRTLMSGVTAGVSYDLFGGAVRLGLFGRRQQTAQTTYVVAYAGNSRAYVLSGYFEPVPRDLEPAKGPVRRRLDRVATAEGVSLGGRLIGTTWTAFAQRERTNDTQYADFFEADPPTDDWAAHGWSAGFTAQSALGDSLVLVTAAVRHTQLEGEALRMDLEDVNFETEEYTTYLTGELRLLPQGDWQAALWLALGREHRERRDLLARVRSDIGHWAPAASLEVARSLPFGLAVSAAAGISQYAPQGGIPNPFKMGNAYQEWIAPEMSVYGTEAVCRSGALTVRWGAGTGSSIWFRGTLASLSAKRGVGTLRPLPDGSRSRHTIEVGVTLGGR